MDDAIKAVREYVWAKYIDFAHADGTLDDETALAQLAEYHRIHPVGVDPDPYYLAILYFEMAYGRPEAEMYRFLARAMLILEEYTLRTGETDWEPVSDRLEEARSAMQDLAPEARDALLAEVRGELSSIAEEAGEAPPAETSGARVEDGMVYVPGGSFLSGPTKTSREVKAFWIDQFPVTNAQYLEFVRATGYRNPKFWQEGRLRADDAPVVGVSWYDAYKYAAFAGKSLPTKDQWEKAARGLGGRIYPWGDEMIPEAAIHGLPDESDGVANVGACPQNVSEFGVRDMAGNIWEWTESQEPNDSELRIICGGSWVDDASFLRCDQHLSAYPKDKYDNIGFRCVRVATD